MLIIYLLKITTLIYIYMYIYCIFFKQTIARTCPQIFARIIHIMIAGVLAFFISAKSIAVVAQVSHNNLMLCMVQVKIFYLNLKIQLILINFCSQKRYALQKISPPVNFHSRTMARPIGPAHVMVVMPPHGVIRLKVLGITALRNTYLLIQDVRISISY